MYKILRGFTIIEIIVVVSTLGILSTIGVVSYSKIQRNIRDDLRLNSATVIAETIEKYYDKNGQYPNCQKLTSPPESELHDLTILCNQDDQLINDSYIYETEENQDGEITGWALLYYNEKQQDLIEAYTNRRHVAVISDYNKIKLDDINLEVKETSHNSADFEWDKVFNASSYEIKYSKTNSMTDPTTQKISSNQTSLQITGLESDTTYYFMAKSIGDNVRYSDSEISTQEIKTSNGLVYLTVSKDITSAGTISGVSNPYPINSTATITATANNGYEFDGWSGCSTSTSPTIIIAMDYNKTCQAKYKLSAPRQAILSSTTPRTNGRFNLTARITDTNGMCPSGTTMQRVWLWNDTELSNSNSNDRTYALLSYDWRNNSNNIRVKVRCGIRNTNNIMVYSNYTTSTNAPWATMQLISWHHLEWAGSCKNNTSSHKYAWETGSTTANYYKDMNNNQQLGSTGTYVTFSADHRRDYDEQTGAANNIDWLDSVGNRSGNNVYAQRNVWNAWKKYLKSTRIDSRWTVYNSTSRMGFYHHGDTPGWGVGTAEVELRCTLTNGTIIKAEASHGYGS